MTHSESQSMQTAPKILCVDDEENILSGLTRTLFDSYDVTTALSGKIALEIMKTETFEVIISDMRMPEMDGAEFLTKARAFAPNTTRILLTGHSDTLAAMKAINEGHIFRFLLKPCDGDYLIEHIAEAVNYYRLKKNEKLLLEQTLKGAIRVLTDMLSMAAPQALKRSVHIKRYVSHITTSLNLKNQWEFDIAAMLSQVGAVALPDEVLEKAFSSIELSPAERSMIELIPETGAILVETIPRLENISKMIAAQYADDNALTNLSGRAAQGARILRIANSLDRYILHENNKIKDAIKWLYTQFDSPEDQPILNALDSYTVQEKQLVMREIKVSDLRIGMILEQDVLSINDTLVISKGQEMTTFLIDRLINYSQGVGINEPFKVLC
jgi:CheY-like chemotaxis protein